MTHQAKQAEKARRVEQMRQAQWLLEWVDKTRLEMGCDPILDDQLRSGIAEFFGSWYTQGRWHGTAAAARKIKTVKSRSKGKRL